MARWGMVIDLDKCTGCGACVVACKTENNVSFAGPKEADRRRVISWMEILTSYEYEYPNTRVRFMPRPCFHCKHPPCVKVCPVGATYRSEEGLVAQIYSRCIGCRYCTNNCPYNAKYFNWRTPNRPEEFENAINPDVSKRAVGVVEKCSFCHHRLITAREKAALEGRELTEGDYVPACVEICPAEAMYFGDFDEPTSQVSLLAKSLRAFKLLEELGTEPNVVYLSEEEYHG